MKFNIKEGTLKLSSAQMDYIIFGKGNKSLIMIQGLNTRGIKGAAASLAYMYRIFAEKYTVYLFDRRAVVYDGMTVRDLAADIAMAMDSFGIKKADVIGVSQGGMIAQYLAIDRPDLVNKLVLVVTLSRNNDTVRNVIQNWIELAEQEKMEQFVTDMLVKMYSEPYVKRYRRIIPLLKILQKPKDIQRFVTLAKSCLTCDSYEELDKIQCPVFVIGGKLDQVVGENTSEEIAEKLGCKIYMYEEFGHAVYEEAKDFDQRVYDFLME